MDKVAIFIDGSNFYNKLKDLSIRHTANFDYRGFSDTDLIPVIQKVRALGKAIEYIGFAHRPSLGLQKHVSLSRLLIRAEIEPFVAKHK